MAEAFAAVQPLLDEYADIERQLADPSVHADAGRARTLGRRFAELGRVVAAHRAWSAAAEDLAAAREMADADPEFAAEVPALEATRSRRGGRPRSSSPTTPTWAATRTFLSR